MNLKRLPTLLLFFMILVVSIVPGQAAKALNSKMVLGYYTVYYSGDNSSYNSLSLYGSYVSHFSTMTFNVDGSGNVTGSTPTNAITLAASKGITPYAAVTNLSNGSFDPHVAHLILTDPTLRTKTIQNILSIIQNNGFKGVNIDFENMLATDRPYFNTFIQELSSVLRPKGYQTVVSVSAKTSDSPTSSWSGTFDYYSLGQSADYLQIMSYDQNGPWGSPGPVSGLNWVEKVLQYATSQIPASKLLIGLPAYGYDWNTTTNTGSAVAWKNIPSLLQNTGATPQWDATSSSPYFQYQAADGSSHTVWYENYESIKQKAQLVNRYNLAGASMWCLRLDDENFWKAVHEGLGSSTTTTSPTTPTTTSPVVNETKTTVTTSKAAYLAKETVYITVKVTDQNSNPLSGASLTITVTAPSGSKSTYTGTTDATGKKTFTIYTSRKTQKGTYTVVVNTKLANYLNGTGTISYMIR